MDISQLNFSSSHWLWALSLLPIMWLLLFFFYRVKSSHHRLEEFIDKHLLAYLLIDKTKHKKSLLLSVVLWSIVWSLFVVAMAGPRWNFREIETYSKDQNMVIIIDLSESMNATDTKPSRLLRAKQKIEDLLNELQGLKIGLIAFAADPHMITPITEDKETIRYLLQSLNTDLVYIQGSRLSPALEMAQKMLEAELGTNKSILLISDGGFEDSGAFMTAKKLADRGIVIHAMGVGTPEGAPLRDTLGNIVKKKGNTVVSKLEKEKLVDISKTGHGLYLETGVGDKSEKALIMEFEKSNDVISLKKKQLWDEGFAWFLLPVLPIVLWWFRSGHIFALSILLFASPLSANEPGRLVMATSEPGETPWLPSPQHSTTNVARASRPGPLLSASSLSEQGVWPWLPLSGYFKNADTKGCEAIEEGRYEDAAHLFQDSYRKGVACYRAGNFAEAEKMFRESSREEVALSAAYNLGNTLVQQQKFTEAIEAYEEVLQKNPDHLQAKENLALVKKLMEQTPPSGQSKDQNKDKSEKQNSEDQQNKSKDNQDNQENQDRQNTSKDQQNSEDQQSDSKDEQKTQEESNSKKQDEQDSQDESNSKESQEQQEETKKDSKDPSQQNESQKAQSRAEEKQSTTGKSAEDLDRDADLLLNRISNDPKTFLKNKFSIESKKNGTKEGIDPW